MLVGMKINATIIESSMKFSKKLKTELPSDPLVLLLGIYPKESKSEHNRDTCTLMVITALFTIAKLWKQPSCSTTDEWIKKMWNVHF
jgi:hypothetical protein